MSDATTRHRGGGRRRGRGAARLRRRRLPRRRHARHRGGAHGRRRAGDRRCRWPRRSSSRSTTSRPPCTSSSTEYAAAAPRLHPAQVGGGWRIYSRPDYAPVVEKFVLDGQQARLTQASLETLAVIAYRQPVSRARVGAVRGVNVDGVIRTLLTRGLIEELGHEARSRLRSSTAPRPTSWSGWACSLDELPALAPYLPEVDVLDELAERRPRMTPPSRTQARRAGAAAPARVPAPAARGKPPRPRATGPDEGQRRLSAAPARPSPASRPGCPAVGRTARRSTSTTPTACACRSCSPRPASAPGGSARTSSPPAASRSTARSSPSSACASTRHARPSTSTASASSSTSRASTSPSTSRSASSRR